MRFLLVVGIDEVGRGCLAGPVFAAAVILHPRHEIPGLADSKVLSPKKRELLEGHIKERALAWAVGEASVEEIEMLNVLQASLLAMRRAVDALSVRPDRAVVDGNKCPTLSIPAEAVVDADATIAAVSAASIIAKTARDRTLCTLATQYPGYGWERNAGYGTPEHLDALVRLGPTPLHRRTFRPVLQLAFAYA